VANVVAFGGFWVGQYLLLDKVLFRHRRTGPPTPGSLGPAGVDGSEDRSRTEARA
jgi:hypothetical protein